MAQKLDGIAPRRGAGKENSGLFPAVPGALDQLRSEPDNHPQTHGQSLGSGRRDHPRSTWNPISAQNRRGNSGLPGHPGRRSGFVSQRLRRATTFLRIHLQQVSQIPTGAEPGSNPKAVEMTKEENPQNQNRDFPLSWKAPTPRFPHSHRHGYCSSSIGQANQTQGRVNRSIYCFSPTDFPDEALNSANSSAAILSRSFLANRYSQTQYWPPLAKMMERYRFLRSRFLKTPPPKSSAWPSITWRMAAQSSSSAMCAFFAAWENHAVLKTRCAFPASVAINKV